MMMTMTTTMTNMWTDQDYFRDLPRIRRLPGVEDAYAERGNLVVITKPGMLRHTYSLLALPSIKMVLRNQRVTYPIGMKYTNPLWASLHWHPTLGTRIGLTRIRYGCLRHAGDDVQQMQRHGPYITTIAALAMLQTVRAENHLDASEPWIICIFVLGITAAALMPLWLTGLLIT